MTPHEELLEAMGGLEEREGNLVLFGLKCDRAAWRLYTSSTWWCPFPDRLAHAIIEQKAIRDLRERHEHMRIDFDATRVCVTYQRQGDVRRFFGDDLVSALLAVYRVTGGAAHET
jgi:hypothetical protein